jgi:hypothetical protein
MVERSPTTATNLSSSRRLILWIPKALSAADKRGCIMKLTIHNYLALNSRRHRVFTATAFLYLYGVSVGDLKITSCFETCSLLFEAECCDCNLFVVGGW